MAKAIFHPQAWVNDYAIEVDPEGETTFDVGDVPHDMQDDSYESDNLRDHPNAPQWVKDWSGPFCIEIERDDEGCEGQDRESYSDDQDRESYSTE